MGDLFNFSDSNSTPAENSAAFELARGSHASHGGITPAMIPSGEFHKSQQHSERRKRRRALISAPVRVRAVDVTEGGPDEILTTTNVSRTGLMFHTFNRSYIRGMEVAVTFPYSSRSLIEQAERAGRVARINELAEGGLAIAIAFGESGQTALVDAGGHSLAEGPVRTDQYPDVNSKKPLVLAVDADIAIRQMIKTYLSDQGYDVIAIGTNEEAKVVLSIFKPALVIAEIEGENLPGYELCAYMKSDSQLKRIPVMLITSSAYPSDYSSAHSLGAVVCMAKPFRQERFGHVVRMLVPPPCEEEQTGPVRAADPTRRHVSASTQKYSQAKNLPGKRFQLHRGK